MTAGSWIENGFLLGRWEVRPRHCTLLQRPPQGAEPVQAESVQAEPVRIEPRVMAVLVCLARHAGEVVTRDEFSAEVWGGRIVSLG